MKTADFNYDLPQELIAQTPVEPRDHSRLMELNRSTGEISHHFFYDLPSLLQEGDLLVMNDSRVIPARLFGHKIPTGAAIQFLLLQQQSSDCWEILVKPGRKAQPGTRFSFGDGRLEAEILSVEEGGNRIAKFSWEGDFFALLDEIGTLPLPEYIHQTPEDKERYQTVYSHHRGSAAAPTAGLHFNQGVLEELQKKGIDHTFVTLHVGLGTFRPVKVEDVTNHKMHRERYYIPESTVEKIKETKAKGGRVIAVGTTACRTLETVGNLYGEVREGGGDTEIFIYPGYEFRVIDGLITNFHLPESTLIMLVSAFAGKPAVMQAYNVAVQEKYRFFSFGDAMLLL